MEIFNDENTLYALERICEHCLENHYKIAVAESVTSGFVQLMLSTCSNAGLFFAGGASVYSCEQKFKQLGISYDACIETNGVSKSISEEMAFQICKKFSSDIGLSITGFASPIPEKGIEKLFAYASLCFKGKIIFSEYLIPQANSQLGIQQEYASRLICLSEKSILRF
ncbi:CinA family protein [Algoriphagus vanfongensis]|uniref:CinA family protein n=1 Tax=Algoriphagus vanfongensis TaxID=426371 RepID=UPI000687A425|nr:CinA family protein [Algoriphagus vanfongensis]